MSDASLIGWLLSGKSGLKTSGRMRWLDVNTNYSAHLPITARGIDNGKARFVYRIGKKRASEPSLLVLLEETCIYRLDVNGTHREGTKLFQFVTHTQQRRSLTSAAETFDPNPLGVPQVTIGQRVSTETYRSIMASFAAPIGLDILDVAWTDPPEGRQP